MKMQHADHPMVQKALVLAEEYHKGQTDLQQVPVFEHVKGVASIMPPGSSPEMIAAAILHDSVEDTKLTIESIMDSFPPKVSVMVRLVTRDMKDSYLEYIVKIKTSGNHGAVAIKTADNAHNLSRSQGVPDAEHRAFFLKRYSRSLHILTGATPAF